METKKKEIEMKVRSSQACIRDGYQMYSSNFRKLFRTTWWLAIGFALVQAVISALPALLSPTLLLPALILSAVVVIAWLALTNWQLKKRQLLKPLPPLKMSSWMQHLGKVFIVSIACLLIVMVLTMLTSLPMYILMVANLQSQVGIMNGDPTGMPEHIKWLSMAVFTIAGFIQAYVWLTIIPPFYLMKASMGIQDKEKADFNNTTI
jgi:hypothetical protein